MRRNEAHEAPAFQLGVVLPGAIARISHDVLQAQAPAQQALLRGLYQRQQIATVASVGQVGLDVGNDVLGSIDADTGPIR